VAARLACAQEHLNSASPDWQKAAEAYEALLNAPAPQQQQQSADAAEPRLDGYVDLPRSTSCPSAPRSLKWRDRDNETWGWPGEFSRLEVLGQLAGMYETGGNTLAKDLARAANLYRDAAEEATAQGKGRLGMCSVGVALLALRVHHAQRTSTSRKRRPASRRRSPRRCVLETTAESLREKREEKDVLVLQLHLQAAVKGSCGWDGEKQK
jgi:TPR repeat protein